jgi:hypothetical protein
MNKKDKELVSRVLEDFRSDDVDRSWLKGKWEKYTKTYLGVEDEEIILPWDGAANVNIPITMIAIETLHPRLYNAIFGMEPIVNVRATEETDVPNEEKLQYFLNWQLLEHANYRRGIKAAIDDWMRNCSIYGTSILKIRWEEDKQKVINVNEYGEETVEEIINFSGIVVTPLPIEDFYVPSYAEGVQADEADHCIHRCYVPTHVIKAKGKAGIYSNVGKELLSRTMGSSGEKREIQEAIDDETGVVNVGRTGKENRHDLLEWYGRYDLNGDGIDEEIVAVVHRDTSTLLFKDYLTKVCPNNKRPFIDIHLIRVPGCFYSMGLPQLLEGVQDEINKVHNQRLNHGTITSTPFGFIDPACGLAGEDYTLEPGKLIPLDNPQANVYFPQFAQTQTIGFQEESLFLQYFEKLTGASDMAMGRQPTVVGATRTATGTQAIINEGNYRFNLFIDRIKIGFKELVTQVHQLNLHFLPLDKGRIAFRVTGQGGENIYVEISDVKDIQGKFDFIFSGNTTNTNEALQLEKSLQLYQQLTEPTRLMLFMQLGLITPMNIYNLLRDLCKTFDKKDARSYITKPKETTPIPMDPGLENVMMAEGKGVEPVVTEDVAYHEKIHLDFLASPAVGAVPPAHMPLFNDHLQKTERLKFLQQQMFAASTGQKGAAQPQRVFGIAQQPGMMKQGANAGLIPQAPEFNEMGGMEQ